MRYTKYKLKRGGKDKKRGKLIKLFIALALVGFVLYLAASSLVARPDIGNLKELSYLPAHKSINLMLRNFGSVKNVSIKVLQGEKELTLYSSKPQNGTISFRIDTKSMDLKDGKAKVLVDIRYGLIGKRIYQVDALIDTVPPEVHTLSYTPLVIQGGTGAVKVKIKDGAYAYTYVGDDRYQMYPLGNGEWFTLFPIRVDERPFATIKVVAFDEAGNSYSTHINCRIKEVRFRVDRIQLNDEFINNVIFPLLGEEGKGLTPIDAFKRVNEVWRERDVEKLRNIGSKSIAKKLWNGEFVQLKNSKVISTFGDIRYYLYNGQEVSNSRHMGYDFASIENSPLQASNDGMVVFTGSLGIYGNTVVIDHGFGLMSLYGHLSEILVKEGKFVKKGEIIGKTGKTGLALGDHLHFGILVHGVEVNPVEWLDKRWIVSRVDRVLVQE
ncbi:MAG: M23 family metallopeptidase [Aquificaceae bacterium]